MRSSRKLRGEEVPEVLGKYVFVINFLQLRDFPALGPTAPPSPSELKRLRSGLRSWSCWNCKMNVRILFIMTLLKLLLSTYYFKPLDPYIFWNGVSMTLPKVFQNTCSLHTPLDLIFELPLALACC